MAENLQTVVWSTREDTKKRRFVEIQCSKGDLETEEKYRASHKKFERK